MVAFSIFSVISSLPSLVPSLDQAATNGVSKWGVLPSPQLPHFLDSSVHTRSLQSSPDSHPRDSADPAGSPPETNVTRHYEWTISRDIKAPDGYNKSMILINGQFPGPLLEANWGDTVEVKVTNGINSGMEEGITLHWHGLRQLKTPWMDGVPGVSQCPIAPGSTFTYTFQADQFGTSWYHSHYSGQYGDGLFGPMVIYGPEQDEVKYDVDLGPVMIEDYVHDSYYHTLQQAETPPPNGPTLFNMDNNLINGKGIYDCSLDKNGSDCTDNAGLAKFSFQTGKTHRLRLMNVGTASVQKFSIDNHTMTVIANDFVPVKPYQTEVVTLGIGQRTDIIVNASGNPTDVVWMRSTIDSYCLNTTATNRHALAAVYYPQANTSAVPANTTIPEWPSNACKNDHLNSTVPYYAIMPPSNPGTIAPLDITMALNGSNILQLYVNGTAFRTDYNDPVLLDTKDGNLNFPQERNVFDFGSNSSVRLIIRNAAPLQHPMHLHGHNFWVLAEGTGEWDGSIVNPSNPQRRDTQMMSPGSPEVPSFIVLEWMQDNPGIWPLHCHLSVHNSAGLYINVLERPQDIQSDMQIPSVMAQTCDDWRAWTRNNTVDQIDSGV